MKAIFLSTDCKICTVDIKTDRPLYKAIGEQIGCDWIEVVHPAGLKHPFCMVVDEEGLIRGDKKFNPICSGLYGGYIFGDAVIMKEGMTNEGPDIVGLDDEELSKLYLKLKTEFNLKEKKS